MSDIVERLRNVHRDWDSRLTIILEAADEIERLRAALGPSATKAWEHMYDEIERLRAENERLEEGE